MGHYCYRCGRIRPNEKFSGSGHRRHVCRECEYPRGQRERLERREELYGFLGQSNISRKNKLRLRQLLKHTNPEIRSLAELIQDIARVHQGRRNRLLHLAQDHWTLFARMAALLDEEWWDLVLADQHSEAIADWLFDCYAKARSGRFAYTPCWCGSGRAYWQCCADRDDTPAKRSSRRQEICRPADFLSPEIASQLARHSIDGPERRAEAAQGGTSPGCCLSG